MEQLLETILLGIIQGLTEWLPVSSTGHLKLAEQFLGLQFPILFDVILHVGTLIVVLFFFRNDVKQILSALARLDFKTENGKLIPLIIIGTFPTVLIGLAFGDLIEATFQNALPIAVALAIFGIFLYTSKLGKEKTDNINYLTAIIVGTAQGIAIIPGVSRSGMTIAVALLLGVKREKAFKFSFLLSIPAILGALSLTFCKEFDQLNASGLGWTEILAGTVVAMIVGYFALKLLQKILTNKKSHLFAFYCWLISAIIIILTLTAF